MVESKVQKSIVRKLNAIPNTVTTKALVTNRVGLPDLMHYNRRICFPIEVKQPGKAPRESQLYNIKVFRKAGFPAFCTDSWEHTIRCINKVFEAELLFLQNGGTRHAYDDKFFE